MSVGLVWFRRDLRLHDNPALVEALKHHKSLLFVYIHCLKESRGAASKWWLHHSLTAFEASLKQENIHFTIRKSENVAEELLQICELASVEAVYWNRLYEPVLTARDAAVKNELRSSGVRVQSFSGNILHEPWTIKNKAGNVYQVFTPYWKCLKEKEVLKPLARPDVRSINVVHIESLTVSDLKLLPTINWDAGFYDCWKVGEVEALSKFELFCEQGLENYLEQRNFPSESATSALSPHLHIGEISVRYIWSKLKDTPLAEGFLRQLAWRDFAHYLLFHFPHSLEKPLKDAYCKFPWKRNKKLLQQWQKGLTGVPIVDAGMTELWQTGSMHNRVRMIVASFLVKHLLQPWQDGASWFWDTLVDADAANNVMGWQWVAGCGADAAPYFRVFNPVLQSKKFDKKGEYIKKYLPQLRALKDSYIHAPWEAPAEELIAADIVLGESYPQPIVDLKEGRERALAAYSEFKNAGS